MKKEQLEVGGKYKVIFGTDYITGRKYHEYPVGEVITCLSLADGMFGEPEFKADSGKRQYLNVAQIKPVAPEVKVGDKVRIIHEGGNSRGGTYYKVGQEGVVSSVFNNSIRVDLTAYSLPLSYPIVDSGDYELIAVVPVDHVADLKVTYDNAKLAYETAVREKEAAEAKAKEALKFTEADIKESFVVEHDSSRGGLRLVVIDGSVGGVTFIDTKGKQSNYCSRTRLVAELNMMYKKTDKTLKDFCNA